LHRRQALVLGIVALLGTAVWASAMWAHDSLTPPDAKPTGPCLPIGVPCKDQNCCQFKGEGIVTENAAAVVCAKGDAKDTRCCIPNGENCAANSQCCFHDCTQGHCK
jgi:hypothetical protein